MSKIIVLFHQKRSVVQDSVNTFSKLVKIVNRLSSRDSIFTSEETAKHLAKLDPFFFQIPIGHRSKTFALKAVRTYLKIDNGLAVGTIRVDVAPKAKLNEGEG